jgi:hypothetical protein
MFLCEKTIRFFISWFMKEPGPSASFSVAQGGMSPLLARLCPKLKAAVC